MTSSLSQYGVQQPAKRRRPTVPLYLRELWSERDVTVMLGISRGSVRLMDDDELMPAAIRVGPARKAWRSREIRDWLDAGCPPRSQWQWRPAQAEALERHIEKQRRVITDLNKQIAAAERRRQ